MVGNIIEGYANFQKGAIRDIVLARISRGGLLAMVASSNMLDYVW